MPEEESQKWCLKSLKLNLAQKMQMWGKDKCESGVGRVQGMGLFFFGEGREGGECDTYRLIDKSSPVLSNWQQRRQSGRWLEQDSDH